MVRDVYSSRRNDSEMSLEDPRTNEQMRLAWGKRKLRAVDECSMPFGSNGTRSC